MEQFLFDFLGSASGPVAYALVFGVLLACGLGFPLPEDVALITGGYLVFKGNATLAVMMAVGFAGILAGDSLVFALGRMGRRARGRFTGGLLARHLTPERIAKVEAQFEKRGPIMVMIARFLPGIRAATYFVAGGAKMSYGRFIAYDGLAALLSAPVFVLAGVYFGEQIGHLIEWAEQFHYWLIGAIVVALAIFVARAVWRGREAKVAGPPRKAGDPSANGLAGASPAAARLPAESMPLRVAADKPALASEEKGRATG